MDPNKNPFGSFVNGSGGNLGGDQSAPATPGRTPIVSGPSTAAPTAPVTPVVSAAPAAPAATTPSQANRASIVSGTNIATPQSQVGQGVATSSLNAITPPNWASREIITSSPNATNQTRGTSATDNRGAITSNPYSYTPQPKGDIILNTGASNKPSNKKLLIIAGVVLIIVAIIGIVMAIIISNNSSGRGRSVSTLEAAFNKYANYVYYGEASEKEFEYPGMSDTNDINNEGADAEDGTSNTTDADGDNPNATEGAENEITPFIATIIGQDNESELLTSLNQYYTSFYDAYKKSLASDEQISATMQNYDEAFQFYMVWARNQLPTTEELAVEYYDGGENATKNTLDAITEKYSSFTNFIGYDYYSLVSTWANQTLELIGQYNQASCINNAANETGVSINYQCVLNAYGNSLEGLHQQISGTETDMELAQNSAISRILSDLGTIKQEIEGGE